MHQRRSLAALPVALLIAAPIVLTGCGGSQVEHSTYNWAGAVPEGHWLYVRNLSGAITVERSTSPSVEITATARWQGRHPVRFARGGAGGDVIVCTMLAGGGTCSPTKYSTSQSRHWWAFFQSGSDAHVDYVVRIPPGVKLDLSTVTGSVHVSGAGAAVVAHTVNGAVRATTTHGPVDLRSVNGSIFAHVDTLTGPGDISAKTVNGSVTAELPPELNGAIDASTVNGRITADYPLTLTGENSSRHVRATLGAGGRAIRMSTVNGSVTLKKIVS